MILSILLIGSIAPTSGCSDNAPFDSSSISDTIYVVTFDSGGGTYVDSQNIAKGEKIKKPEDPTKSGYTFLGWYDLNTGEKWFFSGGVVTENITLTAKWNANKNSLSVTSEDKSKGTVSIVSGVGYSDETITVTATPVGDCIFNSWFDGNGKVSDKTTYSFTMPTSDYALVAHFYTKAEVDEKEEERNKKLGIIPAIDETNHTLTYGLYPQTHVNDDNTIAALDALASPESNGWYLYNDEYYAKTSANPHYSSYTFNDGTTIVKDTTYWFKCELIEWKILSSGDGAYSVVSSLLLDTHRYNEYYGGTKNGYYANNYSNSEIRSWLNGEFYSSAFALGDRYIQTTTVDNSPSTTNSPSNKYACENTEDKVYLLSYQDYMNEFYFVDNASRKCEVTDWAKANKAYCYDGFGIYWTRSPNSYNSSNAWDVRSGGGLGSSGVGDSYDGVRPSLSLKIS